MPLYRLALPGPCAAYLQGGFNKLSDFPGAIAEMQHFGLQPAAPLAAAVVALEPGAAALVFSNRLRWLGALALAAFTLGATLVATVTGARRPQRASAWPTPSTNTWA